MKGEARILQNWSSGRARRARRVKLTSPAYASLPPASMGRCMRLDDSLLIVSAPGVVDAYSWPLGRHLDRLLDSSKVGGYTQCRLALTSRWLCVRGNGSKIYVFDRRRACQQVPFVPHPDGFASVAEMWGVGEDLLLASHSALAGGPALARFSLDDREGQFKTKWVFPGDFSAASAVKPRGEVMAHCILDRSGSSWRMALMDLADGCPGGGVAGASFARRGEQEVVKGVAYSRGLGVAVMAKKVEVNRDGWVHYTEDQNYRLVLCDLVTGKELADFNVRLAEDLGVDLSYARVRLHLDPPAGTLLAVADSRGPSAAAALWNVEKLVRSPPIVATSALVPDALIPLGGCADAECVLLTASKMIFPQMSSDDGECELVELDFWGK